MLKTVPKLVMLVAVILSGGAFAEDPDTVKELNLEDTLAAQIAAVQADRNIIKDFNAPTDIVGAVFFCKEDEAGGYAVSGTPYPIVEKKTVSLDGLDTPQLFQYIVEKGGSISGFGAEVSAEKKNLVQTSVAEFMKAASAQLLNKDAMKLALQTLASAGASDSDDFCYVWSATGYRAEMTVNQHQKVNLSTPGIFIITGKASFLKSNKIIKAQKFATAVMSKYNVGKARSILRDAPPASAEIAADAVDVKASNLADVVTAEQIDIGREVVSVVEKTEYLKTLQAENGLSRLNSLEIEKLQREQLEQLLQQPE
ncbi:hypothetical protein ACFOOP_14725 [Marinicaulis aureus]|uniref:Uncharacterized protein n=1 Tax=Hyphococcus aureus TaxID=2666033 RepID=A0ABW1L1R8_9PROT